MNEFEKARQAAARNRIDAGTAETDTQRGATSRATEARNTIVREIGQTEMSKTAAQAGQEAADGAATQAGQEAAEGAAAQAGQEAAEGAAERAGQEAAEGAEARTAEKKTVNKRGRRKEFVDDGRTIVNMNVEGFSWYTPERERRLREESGNTQTTRRERLAMIFGAYKAIFPMVLLIIGLMFGVFLLLNLWLS